MQFPFTPALRSSRPRCSASSIDGLRELGRRLLRRRDRARARSRASRRDRGRLRSAASATATRASARGSPRRGSRRARRAAPPRRRRGRRSAAASATGFPMKVPPIAPGVRVVHDLRPADHARERQTAGDRLRDDHQVRLDVEVLHREHPRRSGRSPSAPRRPRGRCRACRRSRGGPSTNSARRRDEAAFALLGLEDDRGDVIRRDVGHEEPLERRERRRPHPARDTRSGTARGTPRARTARGPSCRDASWTSSSARATSVRGTRPRTRSRPGASCTAARA